MATFTQPDTETLMASVEALADLLTVCLDAIERADAELDQLQDPGISDAIYPESVCRMAREHRAMRAVIRRLARAAPTDRKRRLGAMCREETIGRWATHLPDLSVPVDGDVQRLLSTAVESVRRRAATDGAVRDALREVQPWAW